MATALRNASESLMDRIEEELPHSPYWLLIALVMAIVWVVYLAYYNSRVLGLIITAILNKFVKYGHIQFGSFSFSVLSGKVMFRDVHLITEDFSIRAQFGWIIFRWWRPYVYKELSEDFSHSDTRLSLFLDGVEVHIYNQSGRYAKLEQLFGLDPQINPNNKPPDGDEEEPKRKSVHVPGKNLHWRDLIQVIKIEITAGRVICGNHLFPNTFTMSFEDAHLVYTTKPASTPFDQFMHVTKCKADNIKVMLVPSPKYQGIPDKPPRNMGAGFMLLQSNDVGLYFYMDEPGYVPHEPELVQMADGEVVVRRTYPCLGVDIKCGKNTDLYYGPWADRQREQLWKFFFPPDSQSLVPTPTAAPGDLRLYKAFEFRMNIIAAANIDVLFTKNTVNQAVHMHTGQGSYIEMIIPWIIEDSGYVTKTTGQLLLLDGTTSMQYRSLVECETLEFSVDVAYPILWNDHQEWRCDLTACKATIWLIFQHKEFFSDLIDDWSSKSCPDVYHFIPYTWNMNLIIKEFELVTLANEYNWIDTSSQHQENAHIAFCGETFDLSLQLPFVDYLPPTVAVKLFIRGESVDCRLYLPESNTSRHCLLALSENKKITDRDGLLIDKPFGQQKEKQWRKLTQKSAGWIECWTTQIVALSIGFTYHPMPMLTENPDMNPKKNKNVISSEIDEAVLMPLKQVRPDYSKLCMLPDDLEPSHMEPDLISVELEVGPSVLCLYGSLLRNFLHVKENYFGEDQKFTDLYDTPSGEDPNSSFSHTTGPESQDMLVDSRQYRPFSVTVSATLHDVHGHLVRNCNSADLPCPSVYLERLGFEMDKTYLETKLQLLLSPAVLVAKDTLKREPSQDHLQQGHLGLLGLQVRGHGMFSHQGLPVDSETLEYAWLMEATIGDITGKLSIPQLQTIVEFLTTFIMLVKDDENSLQRPVPYRLCLHGLPQTHCRMLPTLPRCCPTPDDIKYCMNRVSVDSINLFLVESGSALNLQVHPVRLSMCNLHGTNTRAGITGLVEQIGLRQFICTAPSASAQCTEYDLWLESGMFSMGPLNVEAAMALPCPELHAVQDAFLKSHDCNTKRLWFLWNQSFNVGNPAVAGKCGCHGGCMFFGKNRNGIGFFHPKLYIPDVRHAAVFQIFPDGADPGFGQSLLHKEKLVFDVSNIAAQASPTRSKGFSFTRGYMSAFTSPESPMTNSTLIEDILRHSTMSQPSNTSITSTIISSSSIHNERLVQPSRPTSILESSASSNTVKSCDLYPNKEIPDPYDSDRTVTTPSDAVPNSPQGSPAKQSPARQGLRGHHSITSTSSSSDYQPSSPNMIFRRGSRVSLASQPSPGSFHTTSSRSSLHSPRSKASSRVGSHTSVQRLTSATSIESENYFSAEDDMRSSSDADSYKALKEAALHHVDHRFSSILPEDRTLRPGMEDTVLDMEDTVINKDITSSASSLLSYQSAATSVDDVSLAGEHLLEDLSVVDLHHQINQPIIKSPILMSCYSSHLTQAQCSDWTAPPPLPQFIPGSTLRHDQSFHSQASAARLGSGNAPTWAPHFVMVKQGFSTRRMCEREDMHIPPTPLSSRPQDPWKGEMDEKKRDDDSCYDEALANTSKTTAVVKLKGSVDALLTPLFLEAVQRYTDSILPTLAALHPFALLDSLQGQCLDSLLQKNKLKQTDTAPSPGSPHEETKSTPSENVEEDTKSSCVQAFFSLPKINLCVLQASLVEEVISFSALDNINELTCVSLMSLCIDDISFRLLSNNLSRKLLQESTPESSIQRSNVTQPPCRRKRTDLSQNDKEDEVVLEISREAVVGTLNIARIHVQLKRLLRNSNYSENVILTAIPDRLSKVLFTFRPDDSTLRSPRTRLSSRESPTPDHGTGFIMFESGLEDISLTTVRRLGYKDASDGVFQEKMEEIERALEDMQQTTNYHVDKELHKGTSGATVSSTSVPAADVVDGASMQSWDSMISIPSNATSLVSTMPTQPIKGNASSGILHLKKVWFNFAAPPPLPIKRKMDFSRLDWNLLSTATPAINAWMNTSDRLVLSVRLLLSVLRHRASSVIACIMTEGLEEQGIHMPYKSKFSKITALSKTLQEDPSCQLITVLRKYLHKTGSVLVERAVLAETIPQIITIQKGILALTRQWKNVLYMPYLLNVDFKAKRSVRPYTVKFAVPEMGSMENVDAEATVDQFEVVDEKTSLLQAEGGLVYQSASIPSLSASRNHQGSQKGSGYVNYVNGHMRDAVSTESLASSRPQKPGDNTVKNKPKAVGGFDSPDQRTNASQRSPSTGLVASQLKRNESSYSFVSAAESTGSIDQQGNEITLPPTPIRHGKSKNAMRLEGSENLYQWMAKQQDNIRDAQFEDHPQNKRHDSILTGLTNWSHEDSRTDINAEYYTMASSMLQLADAQVLFKPFLQSMGLHVEGVRMSAFMKKFGGSVSLQGKLDTLLIKIADSKQRAGKGKAKGKSQKSARFKIQEDTPALCCEGFAVSVAMKDVVDFEMKDLSKTDKSRRPFAWKFAMHKLEAKPTTLQVNFFINCEAVTQHVDMPLLRLVHQFVTMADSIHDTKVELKQSRPNNEWIKTHRKQDSKDSTSSADTQQSDLSRVREGLDGGYHPQTPDTSVESDGMHHEEVKTASHKSPRPSVSFPGIKAHQKFRPDKLTLSSLKMPHLRLSSKKSRTESTSDQTDIMTPPQSLNLSDTVTMDMPDTSSPVYAEKTIVDEIKDTTPRCWRTLYHLLELYSTMPETKMVGQREKKPLPVIEEEPDNNARDTELSPKESQSKVTTSESKEKMSKIDLAASEEARIGVEPVVSQNSFRQSIYIGESIPLVVFGVAKIHRVCILAVLSGLKLEADLNNVHASGTHKERIKGFMHRKVSESSVTTHVGHTNIVLLEGIPPQMQTVVTVDIGKTQGLYTSVIRRSKEHNSALVTVGSVDVNIPQHPVVLHGMVTRSSRQLSSTLKEFRRPLTRFRTFDVPDAPIPEDVQAESVSPPTETAQVKVPAKISKPSTLQVHINATVKSLTIGASILPSLKAQHTTGCINLRGMTGRKPKFTIDLMSHSVSFQSQTTTLETLIPSAASIELPPIHVHADYRYYTSSLPSSQTLTEGLMLKDGDYLNAVAEVGMLEHSLTTDLLNHLVFIQKVFMKEVNELVQKVSGADQPVPIWREEGTTLNKAASDPILYSLLFRFKGIQITATTPTSSAVRLETEAVDLEVSNRVHLADNREVEAHQVYEDNQKVFIRAQINLSVSLGQLLVNPMFEEAEPEFQTMAFFKTKIAIRNALLDEMIPGQMEDQEALLINLTRPIILAQPMAFDKAVLVWLNYKNAYEYWAEQRMSLNKEVQRATRQVFDILPHLSPAGTPSLSTLFLQLTVDDAGICVPLSKGVPQLKCMIDNEPGAALVLTIDSTLISACSSGSMVSKGKFNGFCVRFADDFETSWDDWKPDPKQDPVLNACVVPEGTYEVCSRTINKLASDPNGNAKWILNFLWDMKGIDVQLDTNIGKRLSNLGLTLTTLAGDPDTSDFSDEVDGPFDGVFRSIPAVQVEAPSRRPSEVIENLPSFVYDDTIDSKRRARLIENEMNEQAKVVQDLVQLGASQSTIEAENRQLEELQAILFHDFRRDVFNKLKKQGEKATALKDKLGLTNKPSHMRSRSYGGHHGKKKESHIEMEKLASYNEEYNPARTKSVDAAQLLPTKVQFDGTTAVQMISPPGSPDALASTIADPTGLKYIMASYDDVDSEASEHLLSPPSHKTRSLLNILASSSESSLSSEDSEDVVRLRRTRNTSGPDQGSHIRLHPNSLSNPSLGSGVGSKTSGTQATDPSLDFELDIKVFIDSGKCVLHPKEQKDDDPKSKIPKKDKTVSESSPTTKKRLKRQESPVGGTAAKKAQPPGLPAIENTVFFIPSVEVKAHYNSKMSHSESPSSSVLLAPSGHSTLSSVDSNSSQSDSRDSFSTAPSKRSTVKKASLYAWLLLQTLPEEMVISPCLLDFLEQALEPIPMPQATHHKKTEIGSVLNLDLDTSSTSIVTPVMYASFPVNVVVHIKVNPSFLRFNCLPTSRVECLLQVPTLEVVFSTKQSDPEGFGGDSTPPVKTKFPKRSSSVHRERSLSGGQSRGNRPRVSSTTSDHGQVFTTAGGVSVTVTLSDFSLFIFHPYGGQKKINTTSPAAASLYRQTQLGSIMENSTGSLSDFSRKDSLSLNVEFIKVNISRSRKIDIRSAENPMNTSSSNLKQDAQVKSNMVRFSAICDIGTAYFKYDMRRLSEILTFPRAWYRNNLARRVFLGDESMPHAMADEDFDSSSDSSPTSPRIQGYSARQRCYTSPSLPLDCSMDSFAYDTPVRKHHRRGSSGDKIKVQVSSELKREIANRKVLRRGMSTPQSPVTETDCSTSPVSKGTGNMKARSGIGQYFSPDLSRPKHPSETSTGPSSSWETLVLFAVNLSKLDVHVNMSNVMGNTTWSNRDLKCQGRLSIDSSSHKYMNINVGLGSSTLESKGGIIGGAIDLQDMNAFFHVKEDPTLGREPDHHAGLNLFAIEARVDYMGSSVLMTRLSTLNINLKDEWQMDTRPRQDTPLATTRPAVLFIHGNLEWDQFHMMLSRSTTGDLVKIAAKLEEFFTMHLTSSKRVLSAFGQMPGGGQHKPAKRKNSVDSLSEIRHHRHWQKVLETAAGCRFTMLSTMFPKHGTILGGTMSLSGNSLLLACFHGINFRSKSWAIFTVNEPHIIFETEAQSSSDDDTHVVQDLNFHIGHNVTKLMRGKHLATICKLSRGHYMPPPFTSVQEWFHYAFASAEIKDLDTFPDMQREHSESSSEHRSMKFRKPQEYRHDTEIIFALPALQMHLKTKHCQNDTDPTMEDERPKVMCSFITEFEDHIYVAMDAEVILFLHDMVSSYIKEKDKGSRTSFGSKTTVKSPESEKRKVTDPTTALKQDWREFECTTWHLEPTVRLIHWASKGIDPVGIDYVLQKLGFSHARVTIPKWLQRGFMDPFDKMISVVVRSLILALREPPEKEEEN